MINYKWIVNGKIIFTSDPKIRVTHHGMEIEVISQGQLNALGIGDNNALTELIQIDNSKLAPPTLDKGYRVGCDPYNGDDVNPHVYPTPSYAKENYDPDIFQWKNCIPHWPKFLHDHSDLQGRLREEESAHIIVDKDEWEKTQKYFDKHPEVVMLIEGKAVEEESDQRRELFEQEEPSGYTDEYKIFPSIEKSIRPATIEEITQAFKDSNQYYDGVTDGFIKEDLLPSLKNKSLDIFKINK